MPLDEVLDRLLSLGRQEAAPPGVFPEHTGPEEPADPIHQAVAEQRPDEAGSQGLVPGEGAGLARHPCGHNRNLLGDRQPDAREREEDHDAEIGDLKPVGHDVVADGPGRRRISKVFKKRLRRSATR